MQAKMQAEVEPLVQESPIPRRRLKGGSLVLPICLVLVCLVVVGLAFGWYKAYETFSARAWNGYMKLSDRVNENCGSGITTKNVVGELWLPGVGELEQNFSKVKTGGPPCYDDAFVESMRTFEAQHPGFRVSYPSRPGTGEDGKPLENIQLEGVWRPAPASFGKNTPRIVLQHGFRSSSNSYRQVIAAHELRSAGFGVLANNLRDHCYSGKSKVNVTEWGHAYPYDLLGAWDFAVKDPKGQLGGPRQPAQVGLMGFSMGAFLTTTTFGLEHRVPAAWADGPPLNPKRAFMDQARVVVSDMIGGIPLPDFLLMTPVWNGMVSRAKEEVGVDVMENFPEMTLPTGPDSERPFYVSANYQDTTVPQASSQDLVAFLKQYPKKYKVTSYFYDELCHDSNHCIDHLAHHALYQQRLCDFWTAAFGLQASYCKLTPSRRASAVAGAVHDVMV